jgi:hypothetical protein
MEVPDGPRHETIDRCRSEMNHPKCQFETDIGLCKPFHMLRLHLR